MSWDEGYHWGMCKLECKAPLSSYEGKTIKVTNGAMTWTGRINENLTTTFTLPGTNKYNVSLMGEGDEPEYTEDVALGYGEYKMMSIGYDNNTFEGVQAILNSHKEKELLNIGDEYPLTLSNDIEMIYRVAGMGIYDKHDVVFEPKWLYPQKRAMNTSATAANGINGSSLKTWLYDEYFNMLPEELQNLIVGTTQFTFIGYGSNATTDGNSNLISITGKIFIPRYWEIMGEESGLSCPSEHTKDNVVQWPIYANSLSRIKTLGEFGNANGYWTSSPVWTAINGAKVNGEWNAISLSGTASTPIPANSNEFGVSPCFRLAAEK